MTQRVQTQREVKKHLFRFACRPLLLSLSLSCVFVDKYSCAPKVGGGELHKAGERERERNSRRFFRAKLGSAKSWADRAPRGGFKVAA